MADVTKSIEATKTRVVATDDLNNRSFIYCRNGRWGCVLANGTPASLFYAGISEHMECLFALEDAVTAAEVLATVQKYGSRRYRYALFVPR